MDPIARSHCRKAIIVNLALLIIVLYVGETLYYKDIPFGIVVEKIYYPPHVTCRMFDIPRINGLVPEDTTPGVYKAVDTSCVWPEQWILKVGFSNDYVLLNVPKSTWLSNHIKERFNDGPVYTIPPKLQ